MKKIFGILLLAVSYIYVKSQTICSSQISNPSEDNCRILATENDYTHCCYVELDSAAQCRQITDDQYENIKRYKDTLKRTYSSVKIECSGEFLTYSLFVILALLF